MRRGTGTAREPPTWRRSKARRLGGGGGETSGQEDALRELLEVEPRKSATARTDGGAEPLHLAATKGHRSIACPPCLEVPSRSSLKAQLLLRKRASPSARQGALVDNAAARMR